MNFSINCRFDDYFADKARLLTKTIRKRSPIALKLKAGQRSINIQELCFRMNVTVHFAP